MQDVTVAESQTAEFECEVANANTEGRWLKDGQPLDFTDNVQNVVKGAVRRLLIIITRPQDVGEYTYQVANSKTTANLRVEGEFSLGCAVTSLFYSIDASQEADTVEQWLALLPNSNWLGSRPGIFLSGVFMFSSCLHLPPTT